VRKEPPDSFKEKKDRNEDGTMIPREAAVEDTEDAVASEVTTTEVDINSHSEVVKSGKIALVTTTEAKGTLVVKHSNMKEVRLQSLEMIRTLTMLSA
jgi:hypothetical protein